MAGELEFFSDLSFATNSNPSSGKLARRNLGTAVILSAIADYQSLNKQVHESAARFLFPSSRAWQRRYEWALALASGLDRNWLRESLDSHRLKWDVARASRKKCLASNRKANSRRTDIICSGEGSTGCHEPIEERFAKEEN
jgi:hypothetical protein